MLIPPITPTVRSGSCEVFGTSKSYIWSRPKSALPGIGRHENQRTGTLYIGDRVMEKLTSKRLVSSLLSTTWDSQRMFRFKRKVHTVSRSVVSASTILCNSCSFSPLALVPSMNLLCLTLNSSSVQCTLNQSVSFSLSKHRFSRALHAARNSGSVIAGKACIYPISLLASRPPVLSL